MSHKQNDITLDALYEAREIWLGDYLSQEIDVLEDEEGREFIFSEIEMGTPSEQGYGFSRKRVYLPAHLQRHGFNS